MLQIDDMRMEDLEQVSRLEAMCFSMPWSRKSFEEVLHKSDAVYVTAKEEKKVVGYCGAYVILDEADINQVAVEPFSRKKGIGRKMMEVLLQKLEKAGADAVTLEVRRSNEAAIALYESLGFVTEGIRKNFYEKPVEDGLIMWKR